MGKIYKAITPTTNHLYIMNVIIPPGKVLKNRVRKAGT
jgi:hypothetical protein